MIKFNALLRDEGISPSAVRLVRHQDKRDRNRPSPYHLWKAGDGRFEEYQRIQHELKFEGAKSIAAFVATPLEETLFVGLYEINGVAKAPRGLIDPISRKDVGGLHYYTLAPSVLLKDYAGRLIVEWGLGYRAWVQRAENKDKPVIEIRRTVSEPPFPGFRDFRERLSLLASVPLSWRQTLASVCGVYLLTNLETGMHYVGSAAGEGGFWSRWEEYAASGHGGNRRMIGGPASDYLVTILEVASSTASASEMVAIENRWKEKLSTRLFGLNAN